VLPQSTLKFVEKDGWHSAATDRVSLGGSRGQQYTWLH